MGGTLGTLPAGYHHLDARRLVGYGPDAFIRAASGLLSWELQRTAGFRVHPSTPNIEVGTRVRLAPGPRLTPGAKLVPALARGWQCNVVAVIAEQDRAGFAYGTLPGHPESGEELFLVVHDVLTGEVTLRVRAFSRPASTAAYLLAPLLRAGQRLITRRYLHALDSP